MEGLQDIQKLSVGSEVQGLGVLGRELVVEVIGAHKILSRNVRNERTRLWKNPWGTPIFQRMPGNEKSGKEIERVKRKRKN